MSLKEKISNIISSVEFWLTDGNSKGTSTGKTILLGLLIITPIFLIMIAPFLAWIAIAPEHRYDVKYEWLQNMSWIWPICIFALGFIGVIASMIYNSITGK